MGMAELLRYEFLHSKNDPLDHFLICMATKDKNSCLQNVDNCFLDCYIIRYIAIKNTLRIWQNRELNAVNIQANKLNDL